MTKAKVLLDSCIWSLFEKLQQVAPLEALYLIDIVFAAKPAKEPEGIFRG